MATKLNTYKEEEEDGLKTYRISLILKLYADEYSPSKWDWGALLDLMDGESYEIKIEET